MLSASVSLSDKYIEPSSEPLLFSVIVSDAFPDARESEERIKLKELNACPVQVCVSPIIASNESRFV